jgi:hypothetical protein
VAVDLHSAVNFEQLLATAIERENVPICVRPEFIAPSGCAWRSLSDGRTGLDEGDRRNE